MGVAERVKQWLGFSSQASQAASAVSKDTPRDAAMRVVQFDTIDRRAGFFNAIIGNVLENPDRILSRYAPHEGVAMYRQMESADPVIASAMATRRAAVVNRSWHVRDNGAAGEVVAFVESMLGGIENLRETMDQALGALTTGFVPIELIWRVEGARWVIDRLLARDPADYCFGVDGALRLRTADAPIDGVAVPAYKFAVHRHRGSAANPYGESVLKPLYWPVTFSRAGWKWWSVAIEKYGMPIVTASIPDAATAEDRQQFEEFVKSLQAYSWSVVPDGFAVQLHEAKRASADDYLPFLQYADTKKFQVILGQNLTAEVAASGSRAQAQVHNQVRRDIMQADAMALMETLTRQIVRPAVELNFGAAVRWPAVEMDVAER